MGLKLQALVLQQDRLALYCKVLRLHPSVVCPEFICRFDAIWASSGGWSQASRVKAYLG